MKNWNYCDSVAFAALSSAKAFERALDFELRKRGNVSAAQSRVLGCLFFYKNGITQKEIADRLGVEAATLVPIIDRLEELRLVQRRPDPNDRRNNLIFTTERSQATWNDIVQCASHVRRIAEKGIGSHDLYATYHVLMNIADNLASHLNSAAAIEKSLIPELASAKRLTGLKHRRRIEINGKSK